MSVEQDMSWPALRKLQVGGRLAAGWVDRQVGRQVVAHLHLTHVGQVDQNLGHLLHILHQLKHLGSVGKEKAGQVER